MSFAQVVADVREMGAGVTARGSGAGSMVNHARHIAIAGPLDHRLLFERSVSVRWRSLPDIGIDVESARRLEFYDRIFERYGAERVAVSAEYRNLPDPTRDALSYQAQRVGERPRHSGAWAGSWSGGTAGG